jgi:hypothetical protein
VSNVKEIVDELPIRIEKYDAQSNEEAVVKVRNGVEYRLGFRASKEESLLYSLGDNRPLVSNLYALRQSIRHEFY